MILSMYYAPIKLKHKKVKFITRKENAGKWPFPSMENGRKLERKFVWVNAAGIFRNCFLHKFITDRETWKSHA